MVRLIGGGAVNAPAPDFSDDEILTIEGRVKELKEILAHLKPFVLSDKPSAKLVEAYLRTLNMLREEADKLKMHSRGDVDDIIEKLVHSGNRLSLDDGGDTDHFGDRKDELV